MENLLKDSKNKSWFGPNLYKALENSNFSSSEMFEIISALQ